MGSSLADRIGHNNTSKRRKELANNKLFQAINGVRKPKIIKVEDERELKRQQLRKNQRKEYEERRIQLRSGSGSGSPEDYSQDVFSMNKQTSSRRRNELRLPPILRIENLQPGTTIEDIKTACSQFGVVKDCRLREEGKNDCKCINSEVTFIERTKAFNAKDGLNGIEADGKILNCKIIRTHQIYDEPHEIKIPNYITNWNGPPLYSDSLKDKANYRHVKKNPYTYRRNSLISSTAKSIRH